MTTTDPIIYGDEYRAALVTAAATIKAADPHTWTLPNLINILHKAVEEALEPKAAEPEVAPLVPAVAINRSIRPEAIYCLECGTPHTSIRRHLNTAHKLTPEAYRRKWDLRADYPMVTAAYSAKRSDLAKASGLGKKGSH